MNRIALKVDFTDPADIAAKLPIARRLHEQRLAEAEGLGMLVQVLERLAPADGAVAQPQADSEVAQQDGATAEPPPVKNETAQPVDLVVGVVNRENRRIRSIEVAETLRAQGYDVSNTTVSNSLHYAAHRAKPPKIRAAEGRGYYEPLAEGQASNGLAGDVRAEGASPLESSSTQDSVQRALGAGTGETPPGGST